MTRKTLSLLTGAFLLLALLVNIPAFGCTQPPDDPPIIVDLHEVCFPIDDPTHCMIRAWVTILNYSTFQSQGGELCGCGLAEVGKIKEIINAKLVDSNGNLLTSFSFNPDDDVTTAVSDIANTQAGGFLATLSEDVQQGITADLMFEVLLEGGWTMPEEVVDAILTSPNPAIVTGLFDETTGDFDPNHVSFIPNPNTCPNGVCPCKKQGKWKVYLNGAETVLVNRTGDLQFLRGLVACQIDDVGVLPIEPVDTIGR